MKQARNRSVVPAKTARAERTKAVLAFVERRSLALALGLILFGTLRIAATYAVFNHTVDEPAHVVCGMEWLDKGIYRMEPQHPPLARVAAALGPYLSGLRSPAALGFADHDKEMMQEGLAILYHGHRYGSTLMLARMGILPFFWTACLVAYWWGRKYFGPAVGVAAVFLFSFVPPVLAHAGLATTDMALTAFLGAAFLAGAIWLESPTPRHGVWFGIAGALAVLSKLSSLAFFPACAGLALVWYFAVERPAVREAAREAWRRVPTLALAGLVAFLLVWAGYRFSFGKVTFTSLRLPAPEFFAGIQQVKLHNLVGHPSYLLGQRSETGFWYYYPVALAVKTPLGFLALFAAGAALALRKRLGMRAWLPLAFSCGILLVGLFSRINIGIRHVLPMYLGFSVLAAVAAVEALANQQGGKWLRYGALLAVVWFAGSSLLSHPDYLAYFNELGGSQPEKILADSDLDWGQDVNRLGARLRELGVKTIFFTPFDAVDLENEHGYPITYETMAAQPGPGWNAVSLSQLKIRRLGLGNAYADAVLWPDRFKPVERVGKSILLYYFPER